MCICASVCMSADGGTLLHVTVHLHTFADLFTGHWQATWGDIITALSCCLVPFSYTELVESVLSDVKAAMDTMVCCHGHSGVYCSAHNTLYYISFHIVCCITATF